jgi:hypothetical protein
MTSAPVATLVHVMAALEAAIHFKVLRDGKMEEPGHDRRVG